MGYLFVLTSAFLDSVAIYLDKFLLSKYDVSSTIITLFSGFFALLTGVIVLLFTGLYVTDPKSTAILLASGFFGIFYLFTYFKALTYDEGSRVGSLFQLFPVIVIFLSFIFLGEKLEPKQYIGSILIVSAGFSLSLRKNDLGGFKINKAFWFMILSCSCSALVYILFRLGVKEVGFWGALPYEGFGSGLATLCILFYGKNLRVLLKAKKVFKRKIIICMTIIEFVTRISRYILFFALSIIPASIASVVMGTQPFFLIIIGVILSVWYPHLIKEEITKKTLGLKVVATVGIFIGLYLIFL